jgi:hypothetical protein
MVVFLAASFSAFGSGITDIYNNIPSPLPPNLASQAYEATSSYEFGGLIQFAGGSLTYSLTSATVAMSDWALLSDWLWEVNGRTITTAGFDVPLTLNLYHVGTSDTVGTFIDSDTVTAFIPWRPEPSAGCGTAWRASNGICYNGSLSTVTFDLTGITVPNEVIYGLSFNTTDYGIPPTGVAGPYDSLNFALSANQPSVGSNPLPDTAYWETSYAGFYADGGAGGVGTFREDTNWTPYSGAIEFTTTTPEPASFGLIGLGLLGLGLAARRRAS